MKTRLYKKTDLETVANLFYECVHEVNANDYDEDQLNAIAPKDMDMYRFESSLDKNHTLVVVEQNNIIGFGNIGNTGYLDRLYVHKDYARQGVATLLEEQLEAYARAKGSVYIMTTSTITSKPFFESKGYKVSEEVGIEMRGERILSYIMEKKL